jgi:hypothetical protein
MQKAKSSQKAKSQIKNRYICYLLFKKKAGCLPAYSPWNQTAPKYTPYLRCVCACVCGFCEFRHFFCLDFECNIMNFVLFLPTSSIRIWTVRESASFFGRFPVEIFFTRPADYFLRERKKWLNIILSGDAARRKTNC